MLRQLQKPISQAGRRFMATTVRNPLLPKAYQNQTFKENFLSDPSTYPLMAVLSAAGFFIVGMSANALVNYQDLRIKPSEKHEVIPTWNTEHRKRVIDVVAREPVGFHSHALKAIRHEGLGVDHDEWMKQNKHQ